MASCKKQSQGLYSVKDILDLRRRNGLQECLVWWEGFPREEATWEPTSNMLFLKHEKEYYRQIKQKYLTRLQCHRVDHGFLSQRQINKLSDSRSQLRSQVQKDQPFQLKRQQQANREGQMQKEGSLGQNKAIPQYKDSDSGLKSKIDNGKSISEDGRARGLKQKQRRIKKQSKNYARLHGKVLQLSPVGVHSQLKESKELPLLDRELSAIKGSFIKNGQIMYQVQFLNNNSLKDSILLHNKYLKLLWPKKLAEYLLTKIKTV